MTSKFSETTTKENIKENVATFDCKATEKPKKSAKDEARNGLQSNDRKQHSQSKNGDEALKPITNLPKSKEPFETLSSLCNESVSLKSKRKSNAKKRTKEEKFVNLGRGMWNFGYFWDFLGFRFRKIGFVVTRDVDFRKIALEKLILGKTIFQKFGFRE